MENIRKEKKNILLLDNGDFLPSGNTDNLELADLIFEHMDKAGYDVMNLGKNEFLMGSEYLESVGSRISFPIISANLVNKETRLPYGKKYVIKEIGPLKVGIVGAISEVSINIDSDPVCVFNSEILPPETSVKSVADEIRGKVDFLILMSQYGYEKTKSIVEAVPEIDFAISGQTHNIKKSGFGKVVQARHRGLTLHAMNFKFEAGKAGAMNLEIISLNKPVADSEKELAALVEDAKKRKIRRKFENEIKELHKLSPEDYFKMLIEKESKMGTEEQMKRKKTKKQLERKL